MGLFNKQKKQAQPLRNLVSEKLTRMYEKAIAAWANWMALKTAGLTKNGWTAVLAGFVLLAGSYSTYLIVSAFTGVPATAIKVEISRKPAHTSATREAKVKARISDAQYSRIGKFHKYMDSLARDPTGKKAYDGIVAKRPGLMDSIRQVEKYYQQFKNK